MRIRTVRTMSIIGLATVAVLGTAYANAAPKQSTATSAIAATTASTSHNGGALKASPAATGPKKNIAHVYTATTSGGTGQVSFSIPKPVNGIYEASFTANFFPEGTPAAPNTFSCYITADGSMLTQSTATSTYTSGFYVGVNGGNTVQVGNSSVLNIGCGQSDGSAWTWGTKPVSVTLTRLDGMTTGSLSGTTKKAGSASTAGS